MDNNCVLCKIANSERNMLREYDQPIVETKNFYVVTALGQFVEGYVLICTKNHYLNMGALDNNMANELHILKEKVTKMFQEIYNKKAIFFEHGAASRKNSEGTCVDHAHLHAIPLEKYDLGVFSSEYLIKNTNQPLYNEFKPVIVESLNKFGALDYWSSAVSKYNKIPLVKQMNPDISDHITNKALEGLFKKIAEEELNIRHNLASRTSDLLKRVFSKQDK